jgi:hypothetical protein
LEGGVAVPPVVRPDVYAGQQLVAIGSDMRCRQRTILEADGPLNEMMPWQIRPQKTLKIRLTRTNLRIS